MQTIAVVVGGYSDEALVSIKSGQLIQDSLDNGRYKGYEVRILPEGWTVHDQGNSYPIDKRDFSFEKEGKKITFDAAFNIIHGTPGEDGYLQAYWDMIGLPYTGCGHYLSALTFNKKDVLAVLSKYGIPTAASVYLRQGQAYDVEEITTKVGLPCFVKPNRSGSSLGITKVKKKEEFEAAFAKAFAEDSQLLIEAFLDGTEVSVGVIQYQGKTQVTGITEIVSHNEFFDYEAKYQGASEEITPARVTPEVSQRITEMALRVYDTLEMSGMSRSEYIVVNDQPHFIEMNTLPGFSPASILPQQLGYANISIQDFVTSQLEAIFEAQ